MKKYTYITDHPRAQATKEQVIRATNMELRELDLKSAMKVYAFAHRMRRDKVK